MVALRRNARFRYNHSVDLIPARILLIASIVSLLASAQTAPKQGEKGPQVRYNYLNVCAPGDDAKQEITAALAKIPAAPRFGADFEISRGSTSLEGAKSARYVRLRRELPPDSPFIAALYSLSTDPERTVETFILKLREPKEIVSISLEDQVTATSSAPATVLDVDTPVSRIVVERFGKGSVVLARCTDGDQSAYDGLFQQASRQMAAYRRALGLRNQFRSDLAWLAGVGKAAEKLAPKSSQK